MCRCGAAVLHTCAACLTRAEGACCSPAVCCLLQAAINAAFADDGELLFVGSDMGENVYAADDVPGMEQKGGGGGRPGSAARKRPDSARKGAKGR